MKRRGPPHIPEQVAVKIPYKGRSYLDKASANQPHNICHLFITYNNEQNKNDLQIFVVIVHCFQTKDKKMMVKFQY